jgi:hypothetical protein
MSNSARDRERQHQREAAKQPQRMTPQQAVEAATKVLDRLKAERAQIATRAAELAEASKRVAFRAHGMHDAIYLCAFSGLSR